MLHHWITILLSIGVLALGGELLVRYAVRLAAALEISPTVIGLTVVAFGTSAPELATAVIAAFDGHPDLAVGNVIGSNTANIGLILGLTAVFSPMVAKREFVRREIGFLVATALALMVCIVIGRIDRLMAAVLLAALVIFYRILIREGKIEVAIDEEDAKGSAWFALLGTMFGLLLLVGAARWLVLGATAIAENFGFSERIIGLTVVAFGTSVPELVASITAALKKQTGLVLGNIVGSNIFNTLLILPAAIMVHPIRIEPTAFGLDIAVMLVFSIALLAVFLGNHRLNRWEGAALVLLYVGYIALLGVQQSQL